MKSLSDITNTLRNIAANLNLQGDSVEMVVQMLANSLFISEVENISYSQEASLERATLVNSKIQHCVNEMYSVYRGANPRVVLNIHSTKLFTFKKYDKIISSNNFNVYYLGYYDKLKQEFIFSDSTIYPDSDSIIIGLISYETHEESWTVSRNLFYEDFLEDNLSSDYYMIDDLTGNYCGITRIFSDHLKNNTFFDLTLPGFGSRIYYPEEYEKVKRQNLINQKFSICFYKYITLSSIAESELKNIKLPGAKLLKFDDSILTINNYTETADGVVYIPETERDGLESIHYKANKNRFTGSFLSTNSDLSYLLKEYFPEKVRENGVTYKFETPHNKSNLISKSLILEDNLVVDRSMISDDYISDYLPQGSLNIKHKLKNAKPEISYSIESPVSIIETTYNIPETRFIPSIKSIPIVIGRTYNGKLSRYNTIPESGYFSFEEGDFYFGYKDEDGRYHVGDIDSMTLEIQDRIDDVEDGAGVSTEITLFLINKNGLDENLNAIEKPFNINKSEYIVYRKTINLICTKTTDEPSSSRAKSNRAAGSIIIGDELTNKNDNVLSDDYLNSQNKNWEHAYDYLEREPGGGGGGNTTVDNLIIPDRPQKKPTTDPIILNPDFLVDDSTVTGEINIESYTLCLSRDTLYYPDQLGNLVISASLYHLGEKIKASECSFSLSIPDDTTKVEINELGHITVSELKESVVNITVKAVYNSVTTSAYLTLRKIDTTASKPFYVKIDNDFKEVLSGSDYTETIIDISPYVYERLEVVIDDEFDYDIRYNYSYPYINEAMMNLTLYYIPYNFSNLLTDTEKDLFITNRSSYYVTREIKIEEGNLYKAKFNINLDLYKNTSLDDKILSILKEYEYKFNQDLGTQIDKTDIYNEIWSLITKISEVKYLNSMEITYFNLKGEEVDYSEIKKDISYFEISAIINTVIL